MVELCSRQYLQNDLALLGVFLRQAATEQFQRIGLTPSDVNGFVDETAFTELSFGQDPIVAKILSDDHIQGD